MYYAELHAKSNFTFLTGASHPEELVRRAASLDYGAFALTDRASVAGVVRAHIAAKEVGVKLIVGAEIDVEDASSVVLWATDRAAYGRLSRLITRGRRCAAKGACHLRFDDVAEHAEGLLAGVCVDLDWGDSIPTSLEAYRDLFGDRCYLLAELFRGPDDRARLDTFQTISRRTRVPLVAAGDVYFHIARRRVLCDVLTATRLGMTVDEAREHLFANAERHLKPMDQIATAFARAPDAVARTGEIADRCTFSLDELKYEYPRASTPPGMTPIAYLRKLTREGAARRYPNGVPTKVLRLIEHETALIEELHYEAYFLAVWDLVRFARSRGILCQGRGSAANSAVCYCLGITAVDPDRADLLFERFISRERDEAPDIDVDFEHERREEVLQYVYQKYGRDRAGMTGVVITYRPRSAVREAGKALGLSLDRVDKLSKRMERFRDAPDLAHRCREAGIDPTSSLGSRLVEVVEELIGFPRHLSQHTGGMVMTRGPLSELVPIENAAMPDRTVIQWNKDDLDELGILKVDCLSLGMLTAIHRCFDLVHQHHGPTLTLANIPEGDRGVYRMIGRADTAGVFQIESRAQMSMLPRLRPRCYHDLVIEVAIVRPGPIQGNMVHPYLRRRNGEEPVTYPDDAIRAVLEKTLGVPLFQEQAMRLAVVAAGFTPGEADQLRRAMGAWRRPGVIDRFHEKFMRGMKAKGYSPEYAEAVFRQIRGFGDYGFPESHAASFALLVYVSAWLKHHYPAAFTCALLNSQPMGFYAPAQLVRVAREHEVEVRPVDVNHSRWESTLEVAEVARLQTEAVAEVARLQTNAVAEVARLQTEAGEVSSVDGDSLNSCEFSYHQMALRLGFRMIAGFSASDGERIVEARRAGAFRSMEDFSRRTRLGQTVIGRLAKSGAFASMEINRRDALWHALAQKPEALPLFDSQEPVADERTGLPRMSSAEEVLADYRGMGLSLQAHPISFLRDALTRRNVLPASELATWPNGRPVQVAGIVLVRQRPATAKGITFVTLEDETGQANLIVRPAVWQRWREAAMGATVLLAHGRLQRQGRVVHVRCTRLENLSEEMAELIARSRDFC